MPIIKSAIKRVRVAARRQQMNQVTKKKFREPLKAFEELVGAGDVEEAKKLFPRVQKTIDMAAKKNILPKRRAARMKSRLSKKISDKKGTV